ncbi:SGNH/GDSL hydrolase family protein [Flavobacterium silvaticum]|uniref:SGNH/GDSL hydrolase family protein n=1 Tax=Flavobacterium silvaticum TaxID=1852020 RepID=A0A972FKM5_9FLAO|nr:SGNH/GDSL hydrolase family protein [Flavobacterium silvaticum]NMH27422.1 SGNH/GDSL hydrolase family protein [Flavobacterium silvaticum]
MKNISFSLIALFLVSAIHAQFRADGRTDALPDGSITLIGAASSVSYTTPDATIRFVLKSGDEHHAYASIEIDGVYSGRIRVEKNQKEYSLKAPNDARAHLVKIFKATEATNGPLYFISSPNTLLDEPKPLGKKKIEFIGNSITSGMGNDAAEIPCGTGEWFDQHNAYWAYGPILSRKLNAQFLLSSVSGIGMYRNWNDEHIDEAIMPDVYDKLYLTKESTKAFPDTFQPDLVSICLGTNDFSDGDGTKPRLPFNRQKYIANYIGFVRNIYRKYPKTRIILLNSPMVSGAKNEVFVSCLKEVIAAFASDKNHKPISLFEYGPMVPKGCGSHPDIEDHKKMAAQLEATFKKLLDE